MQPNTRQLRRPGVASEVWSVLGASKRLQITAFYIAADISQVGAHTAQQHWANNLQDSTNLGQPGKYACRCKSGSTIPLTIPRYVRPLQAGCITPRFRDEHVLYLFLCHVWVIAAQLARVVDKSPGYIPHACCLPYTTPAMPRTRGSNERISATARIGDERHAAVCRAPTTYSGLHSAPGSDSPPFAQKKMSNFC